ncbi:alanine racemase [Sphingomonas abietis]|uniref:Alanine racemase n=1 Tax=Sphingomonas abietis TaxID=3012344 RepID=A0ABY7NWE9_9SPHN|nr:alanine racemase [Sphingomonas abietis]WBO24224.1 alanine racemase [Sphingomonas abietis]
MFESSPAALRLTIDGDAIAANWQWLRRRGGAAACGAAVKANGYGLGAAEVVARLAREGCRDFFVSNWAEAMALGAMPDGAALSVLHGVREADMPAALSGIARPVLSSAAQVARWKAAGGGACDVMIDTGMNRLGLRPEEAGVLDGLAIETLLSHLACADEPDHPLNERQLVAFTAAAGRIPAKRYSLANSAGIGLGARYAFDLTRPGLALYGGVPVPDDEAQRHGLRPVARIEAAVVQVRDVAPGESVGYGATWVAGLESRVAIINIGYADGYLRAFSNAGSWRSRDAVYPVIGRVSMDLVAVQVGHDVGEGDWLALDPDLPEASRVSGLSQYELLTGLGHRYQRRWT